MNNKLIVVVALMVLLSACGQKGPLYLPEQQPAEVVVPDKATASADTSTDTASSEQE